MRTTSKIVALILAMVMVLGLAGLAYARAGGTPGAEGLERSPAFDHSGRGSYSLGGERDTTPRFGYDGNIAIGPEEAGENANEEAVVGEWGDCSIIWLAE